MGNQKLRKCNIQLGLEEYWAILGARLFSPGLLCDSGKTFSLSEKFPLLQHRGTHSFTTKGRGGEMQVRDTE